MKSNVILTFIFLTILSLFASINSANSQSEKKKLLDNIVERTGFIELPYIVKFDPPTDNAYRIRFDNDDSILLPDFIGGDPYVIGAIQTSNEQISLLYVAIAAVGTAHLITFNNEGERLDVQRIFFDNGYILAGEIINVNEETIITSNSYLKNSFNSKVEYDGITICTTSQSHGRILEDGIIELDIPELEEIECR